ncbi:MAG: lipoyl domain-containing protein [Sphingomonadales bacterium]|nr:lipoyl domain-containing protein [Sphingomonadales bacterium]
MEEIRILEWHGDPGQPFESGDLIVELETHKAVVEVRAGQSGVLRQVLAEAGDWREVGVQLALFTDTADEAMPDGDVQSGELLVEFEVT